MQFAGVIIIDMVWPGSLCPWVLLWFVRVFYWYFPFICFLIFITELLIKEFWFWFLMVLFMLLVLPIIVSSIITFLVCRTIFKSAVVFTWVFCFITLICWANTMLKQELLLFSFLVVFIHLVIQWLVGTFSKLEFCHELTLLILICS